MSLVMPLLLRESTWPRSKASAHAAPPAAPAYRNCAACRGKARAKAGRSRRNKSKRRAAKISSDFPAPALPVTAPPRQAAPVLVLQTPCPEKPCLRHSSGTPLVDRALARLSGQTTQKAAVNWAGWPNSAGRRWATDQSSNSSKIGVKLLFLPGVGVTGRASEALLVSPPPLVAVSEQV